MTAVIVLVFGVVYLGMLLGGLPFLQLDRTGIALLGAIALVGVGAVSPEAAVQSLHLPKYARSIGVTLPPGRVQSTIRLIA